MKHKALLQEIDSAELIINQFLSEAQSSEEQDTIDRLVELKTFVENLREKAKKEKRLHHASEGFKILQGIAKLLLMLHS